MISMEISQECIKKMAINMYVGDINMRTSTVSDKSNFQESVMEISFPTGRRK